MKEKTRSLVLTAALIAVTLLLGLLPIGFIAVVPGFIEITLMCVPVIVGTLTLGWRSGFTLGALFALTSIVTAFTKSPLGALLLAESVPKTLLTLIVPRLMIPFAVLFVYKFMRAKKDAVNVGVAGAAGSAAHTVLFLLLMSALFPGLLAGEVFTFAAFLNGVIEAALAAFVCPPVVRALKKSIPPVTKPKAKENAA